MAGLFLGGRQGQELGPAKGRLRSVVSPEHLPGSTLWSQPPVVPGAMEGTPGGAVVLVLRACAGTVFTLCSLRVAAFKKLFSPPL